jgi:mono/diheme cytochrome c family protein
VGRRAVDQEDRMRPFPSFVASILLAAVGSSLALAADAQHGKDLAQRWCGECHLVASDQARANADVATFASLAKQPGFNAAQLAFYLLDPHPKMPNMALTRVEAADLAAYIATLK